jgi:predicted RNA-binding protein (virulence factor B family)
MKQTEIIGRFSELPVLRLIAHGAILDGGEWGDILLPKRYVSDELNENDTVRVFVYFDSEDRIVATTETPLVQRDEFAFLEVVAVNKFGAFCDWGLSKDLFIPFAEQHIKLRENNSYPVFCYYDQETERMLGSTKILNYLDSVPHELQEGEKVDILIYGIHDLGYRCVVNNLFSGMIYQNEVFQQIHIGMRTTGFVKKIREDEKLDISLQAQGLQHSQGQLNPILTYLKAHGGTINITDKSDPQLIYDTFGMSKKTFKKAVGHLYKQGKISLHNDCIALL